MRRIATPVARYVKKLTSPRRFLVALTLATPPASALAQRPTVPEERLPAELDRYIADVLIQWRIPGLAVAVVRNDSVLVARGYGVRELGKDGRVDEHTVFDAASLTKAFTATAGAILVDRGRLRWDDPARRHLPDLVLPTPDLTANATVRDFLSHGTGLESANMMWVLTAVDRQEVLRRVRHLRVVAPFRETMVYNNVGYTVAGEAIAAAAGTTFEALLRDLVIEPLGLRRTTWSYEQAAGMDNVASPHATIAGRQQPIRRETQRPSTAPAGAVQSSVSDLARWMRLHLNDGVLDGRRFVSDSTMRAMHAIQVPIATTPAMRAARLVQDSVVGYGLGWQIMDYRGHPLLWHTGNGDGQIAYLALLPRDRLGVVVLVNTWSAPLVHAALVNRILDAYLGAEPRDWAAEAFARVPPMMRAQDSAARAMEAMKSPTPAPLPFPAYAGTYEHPLFGPVNVRAEGSGLTLRMGEGQAADLEYHGGDAFYARWRDPLYRENFGAHVHFAQRGDSIVSLTTRINRDEFTAARTPAAPPDSGGLVWRGNWPGTAMARVSGDPYAAGPFAFRFRMPAGYWICPHTHPVQARLRTISGTFLVGMGAALDTAAARPLAPGGTVTLEPGEAHFEGTGGETEVEVRGDGPWGITFLNPRHDPSMPGGVCRP